MPLSEYVIRRLTLAQRELLIAHVDRAVDVVTSNNRALRALIKLDLLHTHPRPSSRPKYSELTEKGRHAVAVLLADAAEALVRAGYLEPAPGESPLQVLKRLKAQNRPVSAPIPPVSAEPARKIR